MLEAGVIEEPTDYNLLFIAPMIFVDKKLPPPIYVRSFCVVYDYWAVNAATLPSSYPCHNIETDCDSVYYGIPRIYSYANASNGFWGIRIHELDRHKIAFSALNIMYWYSNIA